MSNHRPKPITNYGPLHQNVSPCDCPTCVTGDDQWCCRKCHDLARWPDSTPAEYLIRHVCPECYGAGGWTGLFGRWEPCPRCDPSADGAA